MKDIQNLRISERTDFLNQIVGPGFRAEEVVTEGSFDGWRIVKVEQAPSFIARDLMPYAKVSPLFGKLTVYQSEAGPAEGTLELEGEGVLQMLQKLWTSVKLEFGIEMAVEGDFEPLR